MAFTKIIIAVLYFLQVTFAQINDGQPFNQNFKINNLVVESDKGLQNIADNSNFRRNYMKVAENHLSQGKISQNFLSDFFNQKTSPLESYQNSIFTNNPNKFLNRQQNNVESQDVPLALWNRRQDPNLGNNMKLTPSNEFPLTSNILPAPNIANNYVMPTAPSTQPIISPTLTISTSLPSFVAKALPTTNYVKLHPRNQVTQDINSNKVFATLAEQPKITNAGNYYYVPQNPPIVESQKSLSMKTLLPLILNLLNDKNECSSCKRCQREHNLGEIPLIDSGYSKQKMYGPPSDESYEDSESEEETKYVKKDNDKYYRNRYRKYKSRRNNFSNEDRSQSEEG